MSQVRRTTVKVTLEETLAGVRARVETMNGKTDPSNVYRALLHGLAAVLSDAPREVQHALLASGIKLIISSLDSGIPNEQVQQMQATGIDPFSKLGEGDN